MSTEIKLNMHGMVEIANKINESVAKPIAERVKAAAGGDGYEVRVTPRTGIGGWARTRVITTTLRTMVRERRDGTLAKALGGAR